MTEEIPRRRRIHWKMLFENAITIPDVVYANLKIIIFIELDRHWQPTLSGTVKEILQAEMK